MHRHGMEDEMRPRQVRYGWVRDTAQGLLRGCGRKYPSSTRTFLSASNTAPPTLCRIRHRELTARLLESGKEYTHARGVRRAPWLLSGLQSNRILPRPAGNGCGNPFPVLLLQREPEQECLLRSCMIHPIVENRDRLALFCIATAGACR